MQFHLLLFPVADLTIYEISDRRPFETVAVLQSPVQIVNRDFVNVRVVRVEMPEERIERDVAFDEIVLDVRTDDVVVVVALKYLLARRSARLVDVFRRLIFEICNHLPQRRLL